MLDPWIIEDILRRERERREGEGRPSLPAPPPSEPSSREDLVPTERPPGRGVTIIDL